MSYCPLVQYFYKVLNGYKEPEIDNNAWKTLGGGGEYKLFKEILLIEEEIHCNPKT